MRRSRVRVPPEQRCPSDVPRRDTPFGGHAPGGAPGFESRHAGARAPGGSTPLPSAQPARLITVREPPGRNAGCGWLRLRRRGQSARRKQPGPVCPPVRHGGGSSAGRAPGCDPGGHGFDPRPSPQAAERVTRRPVDHGDGRWRRKPRGWERRPNRPGPFTSRRSPVTRRRSSDVSTPIPTTRCLVQLPSIG